RIPAACGQPTRHPDCEVGNIIRAALHQSLSVGAGRNRITCFDNSGDYLRSLVRATAFVLQWTRSLGLAFRSARTSVRARIRDYVVFTQRSSNNSGPGETTRPGPCYL